MEEKLEKVMNELYKRKERVRFFYGDPETGRDWGEQLDTQGYVSKSTGRKPIYLLVSKINSTGGEAILVDNIVKITVNKKTVYQTDNYQTPTLEIREDPDIGFCVYRENEPYFTNEERVKCENFIKFLQGERNRI